MFGAATPCTALNRIMSRVFNVVSRTNPQPQLSPFSPDSNPLGQGYYSHPLLKLLRQDRLEECKQSVSERSLVDEPETLEAARNLAL